MIYQNFSRMNRLDIGKQKLSKDRKNHHLILFAKSEEILELKPLIKPKQSACIRPIDKQFSVLQQTATFDRTANLARTRSLSLFGPSL